MENEKRVIDKLEKIEGLLHRILAEVHPKHKPSEFKNLEKTLKDNTKKK